MSSKMKKKVISKSDYFARLHNVVDERNVRPLFCYGADDVVFGCWQSFNIQLEYATATAELSKPVMMWLESEISTFKHKHRFHFHFYFTHNMKYKII